ncbi:MAG: hypothetical protein ACYC5N_01390 [Endomicrobiales bacterium]
MKVDLTFRDIELILMLIGDAAAGDFPDSSPIYSMEELSLVEKLEAALRRGEILEKELLGSTDNGNSLRH